MSARILCIEDDPEIGALVTDRLADAGFAAQWWKDGAEARDCYRAGDFDLVLLDLTLPSLDGLAVCRHVRSLDTATPLIMLTARAGIGDVVLGLESGADDYVTKPFAMPVLLARIQALLRRHGQRPRDDGDEEAPLRRGALTMDPRAHAVTLHGRDLALTAKEFALLWLFASHPDRVFSRGELLDRVWGDAFEGYDHTVNTHINRLRAKIEPDPAAPHIISTVWGVGYRFTAPELRGDGNR